MPPLPSYLVASVGAFFHLPTFFLVSWGALSSAPSALCQESEWVVAGNRRTAALVAVTYLPASVSRTVNKRNAGQCFINDVSSRAGGMKAQTTVYF